MHQWEGTNEKLDKVATGNNCTFLGWWVVFFDTLRKQLAEDAIIYNQISRISYKKKNLDAYQFFELYICPGVSVWLIS